MNSIKCPSCRLTDWADAKECKRCGYSYEGNPQQHQAMPNNFGNQNTPNFGQNQPNYQTQNNYSANDYQTNNYPPNYQQAGYSQPNYGQSNYGQPNYQPHYGYQPYANQKSGMAIASMILGILGIAPIGLILGIIAVKKANKNPQEYGGKGFAIAGIALSAVTMMFILMIAAIAIPNLMAARRAANEGSAISSVRTIYNAEMTYQATAGKGKYGELSDLGTQSLISPPLANGQMSGYKFTLTMIPNSNSFEINAVPLTKSTGNRSFLVTPDGVIHTAIKNGNPATRNDPPIETGVTNYGTQPEMYSR